MREVIEPVREVLGQGVRARLHGAVLRHEDFHLERTEAQFASLFQSAGLKLDRVLPTKGPISILEASAA